MELVVALLLSSLAVALLLMLDFARERGYLSSRDQRIAGQLIVLTGAAGGLGRTLALEFARRGAILALWDIRKAALEELLAWLVDNGISEDRLYTKAVDVSDAAAVAVGAEELLEKVGPASVIVSNAAIVTGEKILDANVARIRGAFEVNTLSHLWMARAFLNQQRNQTISSMGPRCGCTFVTLGSLMAELPAARLADYCASKAAASQIHECLRWELDATAPAPHLSTRAPAHRIRCLHVQPYMIASDDSPLFAGGAPLRYAWLRPLVPPLRSATVASRIIDSIEAGSFAGERLVIPYVFKWLPLLLQLLPSRLRDVALYIAGAGCAMDGWRGRQVAINHNLKSD